MKVLLIANIPNPYRIPLFNELHRQFSENGNEFEVLFGVKSYARRKFNLDLKECSFNYKILSSKGLKLFKSEGLVFTYPGLIPYIIKSKPDKIIVAGFSIATIKIFLLSHVLTFGYVIWTGAVIKKGRFDSKLQVLQRRVLIKKAQSFIAYGSKAKEYLESLGAKPGKIAIGINTVDTKFFTAETEKIRKALEPNPMPVLSYVGYLNKRKNVAQLIDLAKELSIHLKFKLIIAGDGEEKSELEDRVVNEGLADFIEFKGFVQKEKLPEIYAQTDIFLFQTNFDIWGLVLNEAMAAGCCCLASTHAGATQDLIQEGLNGFAVNFDETKNIASLIYELVKDPSRRNKIAQNGASFIREKASLEKAATGFIKSIEK